MIDDIVTELMNGTGCTAYQARKKMEEFLTDNRAFILTSLSAMPEYHYDALPGVFATAEDALRHRHDVTGIPMSYVAEHMLDNPTKWPNFCPRVVMYVKDIKKDGETVHENVYSMVEDLSKLAASGFKIECFRVVGGLTVDAPNPEIISRGGVVALDADWHYLPRYWDPTCVIEWYDENTDYHISEPGTSIPSDVLMFRCYSVNA